MLGASLLAILLPLAVANAVRHDASLSWVARVALIVPLLLLSAGLPALVLIGSTLTVEVNASRVRFRFGPFGRTLHTVDIEAVAAERYSLWTFGGWGWRFGLRRDDHGRRQEAFTVPFLRSGVAVSSRRGRFYLSSRTPERLAEAIRAVIRREGQA